ncbi:type IIL restriction-modification enzyme MmeI, partial [Ferruginibacter sp.]
FASQIAPVAMWLMDHQMNEQASINFGEYYKRIPLKKSATIVHGNALRTDWQSLIEPMPWEKEQPRYHYILGNPPFIGKTWQNDEQRMDIENIFQGVNSAGLLDYVSCWYIKAAEYMLKDYSTVEKSLPKTQTAFVSTNSITQGEQVGILWNELINKYKIKINFAHKTFSWSNEAKGNAGVHVVIIGFACIDNPEKSIFEYNNLKSEPHQLRVSKINPYLVEGNNIFLKRRGEPICNVPKIGKGNQPTDGGFLLLSKEEMEELISKEPQAIPYIKKFLGGQEFIQGIERFCLWLVDINPTTLRKLPRVLERLEGVKKMREVSSDPKTREMAKTPWLFRESDNFESFVAIPEVSSERRNYIPIGFLNKDTIPSNKLQILPNGTLWHFGVLMSEMHMAWTKYTCGRLESRFQYSAGIVYNNFPWPENPTAKQKETVDKAAQAVVDARASFPNSSLADLYDPNTMPPALIKAHNALDKAVDLCYRSQPFINETKRIEFLFELYDKYTAGLFVKEKKKLKKQK